jgi:hypothetical protein
MSRVCPVPPRDCAGNLFKKALNKSFDRLRTNGKCLIPFVVSLSNHERIQHVQDFLNGLSHA